MKIETEVLSPSPSYTAELQFLRSRVRELEREKAEMASENHRLKNMLVKGEDKGRYWDTLVVVLYESCSHCGNCMGGREKKK